jgi:hypothetical protein
VCESAVQARNGVFRRVLWLTRTPRNDTKVNSESDLSPKAAPEPPPQTVASSGSTWGALGRFEAAVGVHFGGFLGGGATQRTKKPLRKKTSETAFWPNMCPCHHHYIYMAGPGNNLVQVFRT